MNARAGLTCFGLTLALAAGLASAQPAERSTRSRLSRSGEYSIKMVQGPGADACRVEVLKQGEPHWTLAACVGNADDLYFVSDDGESFWVLHTVPAQGKAPRLAASGKKKKAPRSKFPGWSYAKVAMLHDREGNVLRSRMLNELIRTPRGLGQVRQLTRHFKWLAGVAGVPGKPPLVNEAGQVELETVETVTYTLEFKE